MGLLAEVDKRPVSLLRARSRSVPADQSRPVRRPDDADRNCQALGAGAGLCVCRAQRPTAAGPAALECWNAAFDDVVAGPAAVLAVGKTAGALGEDDLAGPR